MGSKEWRENNSPLRKSSQTGGKKNVNVTPSGVIAVYNAVLGMATVGDRLSRGTQAIVTDMTDGWLLKQDAPGILPQVAWETRIYQHLADVAPDIAPEVDLELSGEAGLYITLINKAASLEDYVLFFASGQNRLWIDLCEKIGALIRRFHEFGFIHVDLHVGNIVVGTVNREAFRPYLIDFGLSVSEAFEDEYPFWNDLAIEPSPEGDLNRLKASILSLSDTPFIRDGIEAIEGVYWA